MKNNVFLRLMSLALCLCMLLGLVPAVAATDAETGTQAPLNDTQQIITINMHDVYGDGWGTNAINILENGAVIGTATFSTGKEGTWSYTMAPGKDYSFVWVKGAWSSECFFEILIDEETVFCATTTDCNLFLDGTILYPPCEHLNTNVVVTPPTCTEDGFTTYTCTKCGESYTDDETTATGHQFGDDDLCDVCGYDRNCIVVEIAMADSFGDSWNGNEILIYEDGVLIHTVALERGKRNDTWSFYADVNKEYDFFWKKGNFPGECSFTISYDDEVVYTATQNMCSGFSNNFLFYPPCPHTECDEVVTPPTCTEDGYTTYTCKKCAESYIGNIVFATGHQYGNDSICDKCGYDKDGITINMSDTYGDGWGTNAIEIYADGVLAGTATLTGGASGTYMLSVDKNKEYTFRWVKGNFSQECSFTIAIAGETVFTAASDDCNRFISGQQIYPFVAYSGWQEFGGKVFYFDPSTNEPVSGVVRLPYPEKPLNGITYAPNPNDVAYAESKGETFIDLNEAWFFFDASTFELKQNTTGIWSVQVVDTYEYRYVVNGMIPWHVGMVYEMGYYWYFTGDTIYGGNVVVESDDTYVSRNNSDFDAVLGGMYTFDWYGHLCRHESITNVDGVLRYYENSRLMLGNGLTLVGENYIYVRSNGELVVNGEYYVPANDLGIAPGRYSFDENGFLLNPVSVDKNGAYFENGAWYYYENGKIAYNKGMVSYNGGYIYVRSNGMLATGTYYISNVSEELSGLFYSGQKIIFDENGYAEPVKNGICLYNGELYYFKDNQIQYNAGLVAVDGGYIYVRSNGKLAIGQYWTTNHHGLLPEGTYDFGEDGILTAE